jgi:hypothetical protein
MCRVRNREADETEQEATLMPYLQRTRGPNHRLVHHARRRLAELREKEHEARAAEAADAIETVRDLAFVHASDSGSPCSLQCGDAGAGSESSRQT